MAARAAGLTHDAWSAATVMDRRASGDDACLWFDVAASMVRAAVVTIASRNALRPLLTYPPPGFWLRQHWKSRTAGFLDLHQIVTKNSGPPSLDGWRRPDAARRGRCCTELGIQPRPPHRPHGHADSSNLICCMRSWIAFQSLAIGLPFECSSRVTSLPRAFQYFAARPIPHLAQTSLMLPFRARSFELNFVKTLGVEN